MCVCIDDDQYTKILSFQHSIGNINICLWFVGLICGRGLTLGDLIGVLYDFFSRLGNNIIVVKC